MIGIQVSQSPAGVTNTFLSRICLKSFYKRPITYLYMPLEARSFNILEKKETFFALSLLPFLIAGMIQVESGAFF